MLSTVATRVGRGVEFAVHVRVEGFVCSSRWRKKKNVLLQETLFKQARGWKLMT